MYLPAEAVLLAHPTAFILNAQRTYDAMRHASETSMICLDISIPSLTLPPTWLPMSPATADNTKMVLEYSIEKEKIGSEILTSSIASPMTSFEEGLFLVESRSSTNTNVEEIEQMDMEVRASADTSAWWMKYLMVLDMVPWLYDARGDYIEATRGKADENENEEEKAEALAYTRETIATPFEHNTNNNTEPSQEQQHAPNKPRNETNTITYRSAGNATPPPIFIAVIIRVLASIFCFLPRSHNDTDVEIMTPARPAPDPDMQFQPLEFCGRKQAVPKRPQPCDQHARAAANSHKPTWSCYKGKDPASNPPVSEWTAITSGRKGKAPTPLSRARERTSIPDNRRGKGPEAPQLSEQSDDGVDQMWKSIPFNRKGNGPAPPSPVPERTSSKEAVTYGLSKILGKAHSTGRVPAEVMKKRSEELLQEAYALGWGSHIKAKRPSRLSAFKEDAAGEGLSFEAERPSRLTPSKEELEGGLWLEWDEDEEDPTPTPRPKHRAPTMSSGLDSGRVPPSEAEKPGRESPPEEDAGGLWLEWDEHEPIRRNRAPATTSGLRATRLSPPEAEATDVDLEGPPVPEHITPVTSLDSGLDLEIMPGSYADDTPRPQFTPVFGSSTAPAQQLQVIAPSRSPSPPRSPFYSLPNAQLHGRDVVALRSYPQGDDEYVSYQLERYIFAPIRPPFLYDHNNIVGPRVLAQTRPRSEVQMRRPTASRAYEGGGPAAKTFEDMNLGGFGGDVGSSDVEDESYADDLRGTWGGEKPKSEWF